MQYLKAEAVFTHVSNNADNLSKVFKLDIEKYKAGDRAATIPLMFNINVVRDPTNQKWVPLKLNTGLERHCGSVYSEQWKCYNLNMQKIKNHRKYFNESDGKFIKNPDGSDIEVAYEDINPTVGIMEYAHEFISNELKRLVDEGVIDNKSDPKPKGKGKQASPPPKCSIPTIAVTSPVQTETKGRQQILNPTFRAKIGVDEKIKSSPKFTLGEFFDKSTTPAVNEKGEEITEFKPTEDGKNAMLMMPKRTEIIALLNCAGITITNTINIMKYVDSLTIRRPAFQSRENEMDMDRPREDNLESEFF